MYRFDETKEQLDTLNTLIQECLKRRAPLTKVKFARPPVSWIKSLDISELKQKYSIEKFHKTVLSSNKNNNNDISGIKTEQCDLEYQCIRVDLNESFSITTKRVINKTPKASNQLAGAIKNQSENNQNNSWYQQFTNTNKVP